jgi:hypothetical protein
MPETQSNGANTWSEWSRYVLMELKRLDTNMKDTTEALEALSKDLSKFHEEFVLYKAECKGRDDEKERRLKGPQIVSYILGIVQLLWIIVYVFNQLGAP